MGDGRAGRRSAARVARRPAAPILASAGPGETDSWRSKQARRIQESRRGWLVMWSAWHRTFTAFSCFSPVPLVVDEPTLDGLVDRMLRVELYYSTSHPQPVIRPA